jgi:photosystem II stability/assembly factor-like uncharacterized protein
LVKLHQSKENFIRHRKGKNIMSSIRVLVGTRKGGFIFTSDAKREKWEIKGPLFAGLEIYHMKGSPVDPQRVYASQVSDWFGQVNHRSDDGGETWETIGNKFEYSGEAGTHQDYTGNQIPWKFIRIWVFEPSPVDVNTVYAGAEDAALFKSTDAGLTWEELPGLRAIHPTLWMPGAGGMGLHTILINPNNPDQIFVAISAAGVFRTRDGGKTWQGINHGLKSEYELPDADAEVGHCVHNITMHPTNPHTLFMQKHWDVMRTDDGGDNWYEVSDNLPSDFGFPIAVHAHDPQTIYVVPIKSDLEHYPPDGKLRVYRSRSGGTGWEELSNGLPQKDCYVNVLRSAMAVDSLDTCGVYFGTTGGQLYVSSDSGDNWTAIAQNLPAVLSVEVQTLL